MTEAMFNIDSDDYNELEAALKGDSGEVAETPVDDGTVVEDAKVDEPVTTTTDVPADDTPATVEEKEEKVEEKPADETPPTPPVEETPKEEKPSTDDASFRQTLRELKKQNAVLQAKLDRLAKGIEEEQLDENGEAKPPELSKIEQYQQTINAIAQQRRSNLEEMVELMSLNPKYEDVTDVCTRSRFDDIFDAAAKNLVSQQGGTVEEAALALEAEVWSMGNPYKYMYHIIKKHHPDFAQKEATKPDEDKVEGKAQEKPAVREATPAKAPVSAVDLGTGGEGKNVSGWTAKRIDSMDEMELGTIPENIYKMYLDGKLD